MVRYGGWPAFGAIGEPLAACKRRCRDFQNVCLRRDIDHDSTGSAVKSLECGLGAEIGALEL
jgi:hypothetical protein